MTAETPELVEVAVLRLPVPLWMRSQEHSDALMREFALISSDARVDPGGAHVPARLLQLVEQLNAGYSGFTGEQEQQLADAAASGAQEIDLHYVVPRGVGEGAQALGRLLDEADEYCRAGEHLLTLAAPPEQVRFRAWFLEQFVAQEAGRPPVPWPEAQA